jgi:hypothetical protein
LGKTRKSSVLADFWQIYDDMTPFSVADPYRVIGKIYCYHLQGKIVEFSRHGLRRLDRSTSTFLKNALSSEVDVLVTKLLAKFQGK